MVEAATNAGKKRQPDWADQTVLTTILTPYKDRKEKSVDRQIDQFVRNRNKWVFLFLFTDIESQSKTDTLFSGMN